MKLTRTHDHKLPTGALGLAILPDASQAFVTCADGRVYAVATASGETTVFADGHQSFASACVLLPDGQTLITGGYDGQLLWHDVATRKCYRRVQAHPFWVWQLALSPDGRHLISVTGQYLPGGWKYEPAAAEGPTVRVFDARSGDPIAAFSLTPPVLSTAISADGRYAAAANMLGEVRVWDLQPHNPDNAPAAAWKCEDFTSWGTTKSHHYCGGIYDLAFSPDGAELLCCGMGPMGDPMAGNGRMTWQRWNWQASPPAMRDQIHDGQRGSGLMEALAWHPAGTHFVMAGRQAQGTWNAALFSASDGSLVDSADTGQRVTQARFTADGSALVTTGAKGQGQPKAGEWPDWGRLQVFSVA